MTLNVSRAPTFLITCLSAALWSSGCAHPSLSAIKESGQIAPEALPSASDPLYGPWTRGCLKEGGLAFDSLRLSTTEEPAYDLSRFAFRTDGFRLEPDVKDLKAGRVIGHLVIIDPNDATLKAMDDYTSDWNRRAAREGGAELAWQRDAGGVNVWRSVRMVFQIEKNGQARSFTIGPLNDGAPYEKLHPKWNDARRKDRLFTYGDLEEVGPWLVPSWVGIASLFLPDYAGLLTFETEMVEIYGEDGSPTGCLPVDRADRKQIGVGH